MKKQESTSAIKRSERGQSLVELAISLLVILMLLLGAFDFGVALFSYVTMRDAAQDGALYGSIEPTDEAGIRYRAIAAASDIIVIDPDDITISYNHTACEGSTPVGGNPDPHTITVAITRQHPVSTPLVGAMIGSQNITLKVQVTDTILSPRC